MYDTVLYHILDVQNDDDKIRQLDKTIIYLNCILYRINYYQITNKNNELFKRLCN